MRRALTSCGRNVKQKMRPARHYGRTGGLGLAVVCQTPDHLRASKDGQLGISSQAHPRMGSWGSAPRLIQGWAAGDQPPGSSKDGQLGISPQARPRMGSWGSAPRLIPGWAAGDQHDPPREHDPPVNMTPP